MQKAWGGRVWEKGFRMIITHNTGNEMREAAAHMLAENIMALNPKFRIEVRNVDWKDYLVEYRNYMYPIFIIGWGADYADPHNFLYTYMHSGGVYGRYHGLQKPRGGPALRRGDRHGRPGPAQGHLLPACRISGTKTPWPSHSINRSTSGPIGRGSPDMCPTPCSARNGKT